MKRITLAILQLIFCITVASAAKPAYHIRLKMTDWTDSMVYLVHYYGKPTPLYISDSARLDKNGNAEMKSTDSAFVGGIYMLMFSDKKTYFEIMLNTGDDMSITATASKLPEGISYKNSPENERFVAYGKFMKNYGDEQAKYKKDYEEARTSADSAAIRKKSGDLAKKLLDYRVDYINKYPTSLLASVFKAMKLPDVPPGDHFLADGKTKDTTFAYRYYKTHYWETFNFHDDRLIYTPIYDGRLEEYMSKLVLPWPDSMKAECDYLLAKARGSKDVFHYTLTWLSQYVESSKVMGVDEVFVYLIENYYMKGDATWLKSEDLAKYIDRAQKIAPNVIGNIAPQVKLPNVTTKKQENMLDMKSKYTLLVFYSPNCGHCQHEIPKLDSVYQAVLKKKGVKIYTVATETEDTTINSFIKKNNMQEWTNTWDPDHTSDYHNKYDVYSTPTIYLLDEKKIIRGKRLDHSNIAGLVDMLEKKAKDDKSKAKS